MEGPVREDSTPYQTLVEGMSRANSPGTPRFSPQQPSEVTICAIFNERRAFVRMQQLVRRKLVSPAVAGQKR
jgi:hypothetical protein